MTGGVGIFHSSTRLLLSSASRSVVSLSNEKKDGHTDRASLSLFSPSERNKEGRLSGRGWVGVAFIIISSLLEYIQELIFTTCSAWHSPGDRPEKAPSRRAPPAAPGFAPAASGARERERGVMR